jgi:hypothetical protein
VRSLTDRITIGLGFAAAFWLGASPVAAHPTIDVANPQPNDRVIAGSFVMEGVAYDHDATQGTGVDRVSVRICGLGGMHLGDAVLGLPSTMSVDKGDSQYANAGWKLTAALKGAGDMRDLCVTARSSVTGTETLVRIPIIIGTAPPPPGRPSDAATGDANDTGGAGTTGTGTGGTGTGVTGTAGTGTGGTGASGAGTGGAGTGGAGAGGTGPVDPGTGGTGTGGANTGGGGTDPEEGGPEE